MSDALPAKLPETPAQPLIDTGLAAYGRLSREDEKDAQTPMADKVALRKAVLVTQARYEAKLTLHDSQITFELKSGGSLDERPGLLDILRRCERREIHTLVVFDIDRLTRDVGDWKRIERALFKGQVRLITGRGEYIFTPNFDPTMLQIMAVLGEKERRSYGYRRKAANDQRTRNGVLSQGVSPYGYQWNKDTKTFDVVEDEYSIVCEIFKGAWTIGCDKIARLLNERGVPPPAQGRRANSSLRWIGSHIHAMLCNPIYCGYIVKRSDMDREGVAVELPPAQWIWSEQAGAWRVPVTKEEWEQLQEARTSRRVNGNPRTGLLTGFLYCSQGGRMQLRHPRYHCTCGTRKGTPHSGYTIRRFQIEDAIIGLADETFNALPPLPAPQTNKAAQTADLEAQYAHVKRDLREKEATLGDLTSRAGFYINLPTIGVSGHARLLEAVDSEITALRARRQELEISLAQPSVRLSASIIDAVQQAGGVRRLCTDAPPEAARQLLQLVIARIDLAPKAKVGQGSPSSLVHITLHPLRDGEPQTVVRLAIPHAFKGRSIADYTPQPVKRPPPASA